MTPAPSVILFTVLSGLGFGVLAGLGAGIVHPGTGLWAIVFWAFGFGPAVVGLISSTFHLGQPRRALLAFTQWRSSWLSREGWFAVLTLVALGPVALADVAGIARPLWTGWPGAVLAVATVVATAMIYAQIRAVPRWHHPLTVAVYLAFAAAGGAMITAPRPVAAGLLLLLAGLVVASWRVGDGAFARAGATMASATGLTGRGGVAVFEPPHSHPNYLLREMVFHVGRRHARRLRAITLLLLAVAAAAVMVPPLLPAALGAYLLAAFAHRWLFFAEAEHVVGLYYGAHAGAARMA